MTEKKAHIIGDRERTDDIHVDENVDFASMYLSDQVLDGLKKSGFVKPSPIQLAAIPLGRCGLDLVVQAKSGTGKTCVFTVIALEMISVAARTTQVLVVAPTREIAVQIAQVINSIGSGMPGLRAFTFIGGIPLAQDRAKLGCCHIAVGTPGRLMQLIEMGALKLDNVRLFVLDEADQLLTSHFGKEMLNLSSSLPLNKQVLALSATYTDEIAKVAEELMRSPNHVRLDRDCPALLGVNQFVRLLPYHHHAHKSQQTKMSELLSILSTITFNQCLVFTNSQLRAESICNQLKATGWPVSYLSGGQAQRDRLQALDALCSYKCRILISTDLSARGLDSEHVNLVINLDMPYDQATYLHRVGRAGRFGSRGGAISLAAEGDDWTTMRAIATLANVKTYLLQDGWESNITSKDVKDMEEVESLDEESLNQWLEASRKNQWSQKTKDKKGQQNGLEEIQQKASSKKLVEQSQIKSTSKKSNKLQKKVRKQEDKDQTSKNQVELGKISKKQTVEEKGETSHDRESNAEKQRENKENSIEENDGKGNIAEEQKNIKNGCVEEIDHVFYKEDISNEEKWKAEAKKEKNQRIVLALLSRLNVSPSVTNFSYSDIYKEVSEKYNDISMTDLPVLNIPPLPGRLNVTEQELKALCDHIDDKKQDLKTNIAKIDNTWNSSKIDLKEALQAMIEGKDPNSLLQSNKEKIGNESIVEDQVNVLEPDKHGVSSVEESNSSTSSVNERRDNKFMTNSSSGSHQSSKSTSESDSGLCSTKKTQKAGITKENVSKTQQNRQKTKKKSPQHHLAKPEQSLLRKSKSRQRTKTQTSNSFTTSTSTFSDSKHDSDNHQLGSQYYDDQQQNMHHWNYYYGSHTSGYQQYNQMDYSGYREPGQEYQSAQKGHGEEHWNQQQQNYYYSSYPYGWDHYCSSTYNSQMAYIQSAQKFASMMEYVQSMGRMSAWIAKDYHFRCSQSDYDQCAKPSKSSKIRNNRERP